MFISFYNRKIIDPIYTWALHAWLGGKIAVAKWNWYGVRLKPFYIWISKPRNFVSKKHIHHLAANCVPITFTGLVSSNWYDYNVSELTNWKISVKTCRQSFDWIITVRYICMHEIFVPIKMLSLIFLQKKIKVTNNK